MLVLYNKVDYWSSAIGINIQKEIFMWITTTIVTRIDYWKSSVEQHTALVGKKLELQAADGDGLSIPPWDNDVQKDEPIMTIKRKWNTLECATEFVNWTNTNASWCVSTIEEVTA